VLNLKDVIEAKDRDIRQLQEEVDGLRKGVLAVRVVDVQTASFKKITLGKRTPKSVSQFNSEPGEPATPMAQSILLEKAGKNRQNSKSTAILQKMESSSSVKSLKSINIAQTPKNSTQ
jgi:hypothetical protein